MKTPVPRVSILMPVRNEEAYLPAALRSLTRQTLREWELLAVDDGSVDGTPAILAEAAQNDRRIRVITLPGSGLVTALNTGLASCRAPLLARMDGDDISHPLRLAKQADYLDNHKEVGLVACNFRHFPRSGLKQGMHSYELWQNSLLFHELITLDSFVESPFVHPSIMMRRPLLDDLGGYRDNHWPEDYDLWLRLLHDGVTVARIPETLFFWRDHPERATRVMNEYSTAAFRSCKIHHLLAGFLADTTNVVIVGAGAEGRAWHRLLTDSGIAVSAWIDVDTRKTGRNLHGSPVLEIQQLVEIKEKMIVAIGVHGARHQFRSLAQSLGFIDGKHFICVS